jgi:hypothetical protein
VRNHIQLANTLRGFIPDGDGHNSDYANTLEAAADALERLALAAIMLDNGFDPHEPGYDMQAINQAHRIAHGGELPRDTMLDDAAEFAGSKLKIHVDQFTEAPPIDDHAAQYAAFFLLLHRLPSYLKVIFHEWIDQYKLFCTWRSKRYRVTGASRMGDIWLAQDFERDIGYDHRVDLAECSAWSDKP